MLKPTTTIEMGRRYSDNDVVSSRASGWSGNVCLTFEQEDGTGTDRFEVNVKHGSAKKLLAQLRTAVKEAGKKS